MEAAYLLFEVSSWWQHNIRRRISKWNSHRREVEYLKYTKITHLSIWVCTSISKTHFPLFFQCALFRPRIIFFNLGITCIRMYHFRELGPRRFYCCQVIEIISKNFHASYKSFLAMRSPRSKISSPSILYKGEKTKKDLPLSWLSTQRQ